MTSRERLLAVLDGRIPDRVPISCYELVGWDMNDWYNQRESYKPLMDIVREKIDCVYMAHLPTPVFGNAADDVKDGGTVLQSDRIEIETWREGNSIYRKVIWHSPKGDLTSLHRTDDNIYTTWTLEHLLKEIDDIDKYLSMDGQQIDEPDMTEFAETQRQLGEKGIMLPSLSDPICEAAELFEMSQFLVYALTDTDKIKYLMDAIHERQMSYLKSILDAGVKAEVNWSEVLFRICGPEYATPPYLSPEYFAMFVTSYVKKMSDLIHDYGAMMRLHSHGKIAKVLDEIMKTEPDALDPIEPPPDGDITLGEVKKIVGDKITLFGNIELRLLEHGSIEEVRQFVIDAMEQAKPGGRFVIMPTAAPINDPISAKTLENYKVFIETALEYGKY